MKKIIVMLLVLTMALSMVACYGGESAAEDVKTVVYWTIWESTEPQGQAIAAAAGNFTKETGIKVDLQFMGRAGMREGLQPALDAGQVIDVFDGDIDCVNTTFAPYLLDLEELAAKYDYEKTAIASLIGACREAGGKLMSIPYQLNVVNFFYNAKIFEEVGATEPKTWEELLDVCAKIKAAGYIPITCDDAYITCMIGYHLGRLVGEDGVRDIVINAKWDDPAVVQFAKQYEELASLGYFSTDIESNVWPTGQNVELAGGQAAMYLNGSWLPNDVKGITGENFVWGCFSYPTVENGTVGLEAANYGAQVYAINNKTQVADEAFQLINYLTKGVADQTLSMMSMGIPADTTNTEWPAFVSGVKPVMEATTLRWSWAAGVESNDVITPAIRENVLKLCGGSISADEFIENMLAASGR